MSAEKLSLGQQILEGLGGAGNIKVFENCMTRLRAVSYTHLIYDMCDE